MIRRFVYWVILWIFKDSSVVNEILLIDFWRLKIAQTFLCFSLTLDRLSPLIFMPAPIDFSLYLSVVEKISPYYHPGKFSIFPRCFKESILRHWHRFFHSKQNPSFFFLEDSHKNLIKIHILALRLTIQK